MPFLSSFANGDMGVDIFFVLSGFLIGYILLKECSQHDGDLDTFQFIRNRFLRIWPALLVFSAVNFLFFLEMIGFRKAFTTFLGNLTFTVNFTGALSHTWSVAVEF